MTAAKLPPALLPPAILALRVVHYAVLAFGMVGWLVPSKPILIVYLAMLAGLVAQWRLNRDTCLLDNLESWLVHGRFRAPGANPDEGAFVANLVHKVFGVRLTRRASDMMIYGLMALFFLLGALHLAWRW